MKLLYSFESYEKASLYFNVGKTSILNYSKSGKCFKGKYYIKSNFFWQILNRKPASR